MQTADVNEVNIVVKCFNRRSLSLKQTLENLKFRDRESVRAIHNNVYLMFTCQSAVCVCCTPKFFDEH